MRVPPFVLPDPELADDRVRLRPPGRGDEDDIVAACRDPLVQRFTRIPDRYTGGDARAFVDGAPERRAGGFSLELAIADPEVGRLAGMIGLVRDRYDVERAEVGYWVAPWARGAGLASHALALVSRWAIEDVGFVRIDLVAALSNAASLRVAERCGFVREGTARRSWYRGGGREDMALFSLVEDDL